MSKKDLTSPQEGRQLITEQYVFGHMAQWICRQSPYRTVQGVDAINRTLSDAMTDWNDGIFDLRMRWFETSWELVAWIEKALEHDLTAKMLNTPKHKRPPVNMDDLSDPTIYSYAPEHDFIDLDALYRNVAFACFKEARTEY